MFSRATVEQQRAPDGALPWSTLGSSAETWLDMPKWDGQPDPFSRLSSAGVVGSTEPPRITRLEGRLGSSWGKEVMSREGFMASAPSTCPSFQVHLDLTLHPSRAPLSHASYCRFCLAAFSCSPFAKLCTNKTSSSSTFTCDSHTTLTTFHLLRTFTYEHHIHQHTQRY